MEKNVLNYEPALALFVSDNDPLIFYKRLISISDFLLKPGGKCYFEINEQKGEEVKNLMTHFNFCEVKIHQDINGKDRIVSGVKKKL